MKPKFPIDTAGLPPMWPRKKRWRQRRRDLLWRLRARVRRKPSISDKALRMDPDFPDLVVATIAVSAKYQDWCLSMIESLREAGGYKGPIYVVTETPAVFETMDNVAAIHIPSTSHRLLIKSFKALLARWVPADRYLYIDADVVIAAPLAPWYDRVAQYLRHHSVLAYPANNPVRNAYHGGILLVQRMAARPFMDRWLWMLRHGFHHSDQVCLKAIADESYLGYLSVGDASGEFTYLYRILDAPEDAEKVAPGIFVHVTNGAIRNYAPETLKHYLREHLGLSRLPRHFD